MNDTHLVGTLRHLAAKHDAVARHLDARGNGDKATELRGAGQILRQWADVISAEKKP